ncbi:pilin N-terminal domain-containing protein [Streptococcus suis]|uniref:pilin N-terminal domain-containing protein n=1 Tax=Streptococcus suis TaxID=1307 RepID=UPI0037D35803
MKKLTKLFSLLTVLLTMFGPLGNLRHLVHANTTQETKVFVHKILLNKNEFETFNHEEKKAGYNGNQIDQITTFFGSSAKEIEGVNFKVWQKVDQAQDNVTKTGTELGITGEGAEENYKLFENAGNKKYGSEGVNTTASGAEFTLPNGTYIFVEDKEHSPYYNKEGVTAGNELTEAKAVPFRLVLPVTRPEGTGYFDTTTPLHVYPKNTEDKPTVTKTFKDGTINTKNVMIGEDIEYKIVTTIPKGSSYKTIVWEDLMVNGLDFVTGSLAITSEQLRGALEETTHYSLAQDKRGFLLNLNAKGVAAVEEAAKTQNVTITLTYKAVLNDSAIVDTEIPNEVKFHYGNRPRTNLYNEPKPVEPKEENGEFKIKITKTWSDNNVTKQVIFDVYEKETGVKAGEITISAGQSEGSITKGIKKNTQYIAVERYVEGYVPNYSTNDTGIAVTNNPSDNPPPLTPDKPKVITHGKRFIKTDNVEGLSDSTVKLLGAEFVVKNGDGSYLALKSEQDQTDAVNKYKQAEQDYLTAVKASNDQDGAKKAARDAAYETLNMQWKWVATKEQAFTFISSTDGKFEVKGLKAGQYELVETKAPEGYALPSTTVPFTVGLNSWGKGEEVTTANFQQVKNKKITIPQTGGIGTLVFTVVGLSVMAFAYIAMKKRQAEDA